MNRPDFVVFILSHGRPHYAETYRSLKRYNYGGRIVFLLDCEDEFLCDYQRIYGESNCYVFNKRWCGKRVDTVDNFHFYSSPLFARQEAFTAARELGYKYFLVLDDDYYAFCHKQPEREVVCYDLDKVFSLFVEFLASAPRLSAIAFAQGGDHFSKYDPSVKNYRRKCMNSWFCCVDREFSFKGTLNDDVNTCIYNGQRGHLFLTIFPFMLHQEETQQVQGGLTETYQYFGTYVKSFYSVILAPNAVKIATIGLKHPRVHHRVFANKIYPCILSDSYVRHS